jgi:hypothetical protein
LHIVVGRRYCHGRNGRAHGFGQRYDLLAFAFYIVGAGLTVAFVRAGGAVLHAERVPRDYPHLCCTPRPWLISRLTLVVRAACAAYFLFLIVAGIAGDQNPFRNIIVVSVWIIGWVGISLACAFLGDVWRLIDPWSTIFAGLERLYASMRAGRVLGANRRYPKLLAAWQAVVLFVGFAWMELIWSGRDVPARLAQAMLLYSPSRGPACSCSAAMFGGRMARCFPLPLASLPFGISPPARAHPRSVRPPAVSFSACPGKKLPRT